MSAPKSPLHGRLSPEHRAPQKPQEQPRTTPRLHGGVAETRQKLSLSLCVDPESLWPVAGRIGEDGGCPGCCGARDGVSCGRRVGSDRRWPRCRSSA
jgi:hypothetical protein